MTAAYIQSVAAAALWLGESLLRDWLPGGTLNGDEYDVRNPRRADDDCTGNFRVNVRTGEWSDFAIDGVKGGDRVSLYAYLHDMTQLNAARELARQIGHADFKGHNGAEKICSQKKSLKPPSQPSQSSQTAHGAKDKKADGYWAGWSMVCPVPGNAPTPPAEHKARQNALGVPSRTWAYRDADGETLLHVYRFDLPDGSKETRPLTLWADEKDRMKWRWKAPDKNRPLYNLDGLSARPNTPVLVVEGEKSADAGAALLPGYVSTTSSFGSGGAEKSDWSPLKGRDVTIWPDRDAPGEKYAANVVRLALQAGATRVSLVDWRDAPDELKATLSVGTDIADLPDAGWTVEHIAAMVDGAQEQRAKKNFSGRESSKRPSPSSQPSQTSPDDGEGEPEPESFGADKALVDDGIARCQDDPGILFSPDFLDAWRRIRAVDPEEDARIRVAVKQAKPSGILLADLDKAVRGDEESGGVQTSMADALIALVLARAELFHDVEKAAFATTKPVNGCARETFKLGTQAFADWLSYSYYESTAESNPGGIGSAVGETTLKSAIVALSGIAKHGNEERPCYLRAAPWGEGYSNHWC